MRIIKGSVWANGLCSCSDVEESRDCEAAELPPALDTCSALGAISSFRVSAACVLVSLAVFLTEVNVPDVLLLWSFPKAAVARPGKEDAPLLVSTLFSGILVQRPS